MNSLVTLLTLEKFYPEEKTPFSLNITFKKDLSRNDVIDLIGALKSPQVILWYIGDYGFREQGVNYYGDREWAAFSNGSVSRYTPLFIDRCDPCILRD